MNRKLLAGTLAVIVLVATSSRADDPITLTPAPMELTSTACGDGWKRWDGIGDAEGAVAYRERLTALAAQEGDVWVGRSHGQLLSRRETSGHCKVRSRAFRSRGSPLKDPTRCG